MNTKLNAINLWRVAQGLEPLQSSGKTAKAKANGSMRQAQANAAARAEVNREMKSNRQQTKRR